MTQAYCVRCRQKVDVLEGKEVTMKNGNRALRGKCGKCKTTTVMCILGKKKAA